MAEAVTLAKLHRATEVDQALGIAAIACRFAENDLIRILTHHTGRDVGEPSRASEDHSLQPGSSRRRGRPGSQRQSVRGSSPL